MSTLPPCPQCQSEYSYEDGGHLVCPECGHEWSVDALPAAGDDARHWGPPFLDGAAATFLAEFVEKAKASGLVARFIAEHKVRGLSVAPPA